MKDTEQKVIAFIQENKLISYGDRILIALSGGPDSVFLLHFLYKFRRKYNIEIGAAHINHKLRGSDSDNDEIFCSKICRELSIQFFKTRKNVKTYSEKNKISLENAGRIIRYNYFNKISMLYGYNKIATAHNQDDNSETVLLNLIKGAGLKGISGIPVKRDSIIRPVLSLSKNEIMDYLKVNKLEYRTDLSNFSDDYERNFIRNKIIPLIKKDLNPSFGKSVLTTSLNLQQLIKELNKYSEISGVNIKILDSNKLKVPLVLFSNEHSFFLYFLKDYLENFFKIQLKSKDMKKISSLTLKNAGKSEELTGGLAIYRSRESLEISRIINKNNSTPKVHFLKVGQKKKLNGKTLSISKSYLKKINIDNSKDVEYISGDKIESHFEVRGWNDGEKFYPIGMKGSKKVSDFLNDIKTDPFKKKEQLVLVNEGKIIWIIGKRLDDRFRVTTNTRKVLKLCLK